MTQRDALNILKTGQNVFITGPAGSGKTYVVNQYIRYLKDHEVPLGITASTGIAATHMGGVTIHSWSGISIKDLLSGEDLAEISSRAYVKNKIEAAKVLIIDEVSMLHHFRFDMVERVLRHIRKCEEPFGGLQVVLCGDFFQLPPVSRMGEQPARFIYESQSWKEGKFTVCYLSENYRQVDDVSLSILNEIRSGEVSEDAHEKLMSRHVGSQSGRKETDVCIGDSSVKSGIEPTRLFTHNVDVDLLNDRELNKVDGYEIIYEMASRGRKPLVMTLMKSCLAPEKLRLKKGARVMCVKNNFEKGYVNGTLGVIVSCGFGVDPVIRTAATPDFPDGRLLTLELATWAIEDDGKVLAEIHQYPLRLAWAITVHKSQGMSLDAVEVDLSRSFEPGMGYVALSRVRTLAGLTILGINGNALRVHPEVLEFDHHLRELSDRALRIIESTDEKDIIQAHNEFLAKAAPMYSMQDGKLVRGEGAKKIKPHKPSTFEKTALLVKAKKSLEEMAKERGVNSESVVAQIERLIDGGKGAGDGLKLSEIQYLKKEISPSHFSKLEKALEEVFAKMSDDELPPLSPIKSKIGANISWKEIRLARVLLGYVKKKVND